MGHGVSTEGVPALLFRALPDLDQPTAGELWIRPATLKDRSALSFSLLALRRGPDAFVRAEGAITAVVVDIAHTGPTFDDMLASSLLIRRLASQAVAGYEAFAHYAHAVRRGLTPTKLPPGETLENVFLAIRNEGGGDLSRAEVVEKFAEGWERMLARIDEAAARNESPLEASLFLGDARFTREIAYLRGDEEVYKKDVSRGEVWIGKMPGESEPVAALLLREPRSKAFKNWARADTANPTGRAFGFLAVHWGAGKWVFSTDPMHGIKLTTLAQRLSQAEAALPEPAGAWFDGEAFDHTLVSNPRNGTRLDTDAVRRLVLGEWFQGRRPTSGISISRRQVIGSAIAASLGAAGTAWLAAWFNKPQPILSVSVPVPPAAVPEGVAIWARDASGVPLVATPIGEEDGYRSLVVDGKNARFIVPMDAERTAILEMEIGTREGSPPSSTVTVEVAGNAPLEAKVQGSRFRAGAVRCRTGDNPVQIRFRDGEGERVEDVHLWVLAAPLVAYLHVLAVGVSKYDSQVKKPSRFVDLTAADRDAVAFATELKASEGSPYDRVSTQVLVNEKATRTAILEELGTLLENVKKAAQQQVGLNLAIVFLAGHGEVEPSGEFVFLPHNYDPNSRAAADVSGITEGVLRKWVAQFPCPVVLIVDACHSGAFGLRGDTDTDRALKGLKLAGNAVFLLAACQKDQTTREVSGQYGFFTRAVIDEFHSEKGTGPFVTLQDIRSNVDKAKTGSDPAYDQTAPIPWQNIPLVRRRTR